MMRINLIGTTISPRGLDENTIDLLIALAGIVTVITALLITLPGSVKHLAILLPVILIFLCVFGAIATGITFVKKDKKDIKKEKSAEEVFANFWLNAPDNHILVLRNAWSSNPDTNDGYTAKKEGWRFILKKAWHIVVGLVDMSPKARNLEPITVSSSDGQNLIVDARIITSIPDPNAAINYAIRVDNDDKTRNNFEDDQASVILNQLCAKKTMADLIEIEEGELGKMEKNAARLFNQAMNNLRLGIWTDAIEIQKFLPPEEVRAASEYKTVAQMRQEAAKTRGSELKIIKEATQADGTKLAVADIIREGLESGIGTVANILKTARETEPGKTEGKGGKNEQ